MIEVAVEISTIVVDIVSLIFPILKVHGVLIK